MIGSQPVAVQKEIVNLVGEDELFDFDALFAKTCGEVDSLREIDVAVIVAVDEEDGRRPSVHRSNRRRVVRQLGKFGGDVFSVPVVGGPIVDPVKIDTSGEEIRVASEAERREIAAVASAPETDALEVNVGAALQEFSGGDDILVFRRAASGAAGRSSERAAAASASSETCHSPASHLQIY